MIQRLLHFLSPPPGPNDAGTVRLRLLSLVLNIHIVIALSVGLFYPENPGAPGAARALALATIPLALLMRVLLHRGMARTASWIFLVLVSLAIPALSLYVSGSVAFVTVSIPQMLLIVMAGMLLRRWEAMGFVLLVVSTNAALFRIEALRLPERAEALGALWIVQTIFFTATGALLARAVAMIEEAFTLAAREGSERVAVEAALRDSMERYRLITTVSSDYTFSTEMTEGQGLRLNWVAGAFEAITGFTYEDYVARGGWLAALHPDDAVQNDLDLKTLQQNRPIATELRTICRDGSVRWVRVYAHPVWDETNQCLKGIYGAVQDISERKAAEAEREALIRELERRNAELERFTYTVSHDLKSPLITIRGFLGHIEVSAIEGRLDAVRADMERVFKATAKMHLLLDDLLQLSRIGRQAKPPVEVPFEAIVRDALDRTHGRLSEQKAVVEVESSLPTVFVDRDRLVEVMQNLIDNAAKFMGDQTDPHIWIGISDQGTERAFFVRDNGAGIEPQHRERVFNLFDKLNPKSEGTGVGLALVKRIVEVHGGRIWVESAGQGKGSTFLFTLGGLPAESRLLATSQGPPGGPV